jgi:hypothetical protein
VSDPDGDLERYDGRVDCTAAVNVKGEHISCDIPGPHHAGLAHSNKAHEMIWQGAEGDR